jgi:hypothetical protein
MRPHKLRLGDIDGLNELVAGGCTVVAAQPEKWHVENAAAEPVQRD